jgi:hypothetical protein
MLFIGKHVYEVLVSIVLMTVIIIIFLFYTKSYSSFNRLDKLLLENSDGVLNSYDEQYFNQSITTGADVIATIRQGKKDKPVKLGIDVVNGVNRTSYGYSSKSDSNYVQYSNTNASSPAYIAPTKKYSQKILQEDEGYIKVEFTLIN